MPFAPNTDRRAFARIGTSLGVSSRPDAGVGWATLVPTRRVRTGGLIRGKTFCTTRRALIRQRTGFETSDDQALSPEFVAARLGDDYTARRRYRRVSLQARLPSPLRQARWLSGEHGRGVRGRRGHLP